MELLDEDGDVFTFDWSKAEKHEPAPSDEDPMAADSWSSLAVLPAVAKLVWKAPFAAFASLLRVWSTVVGSRVAKSSNA